MVVFVTSRQPFGTCSGAHNTPMQRTNLSSLYTRYCDAPLPGAKFFVTPRKAMRRPVRDSTLRSPGARTHTLGYLHHTLDTWSRRRARDAQREGTTHRPVASTAHTSGVCRALRLKACTSARLARTPVRTWSTQRAR